MVKQLKNQDEVLIRDLAHLLYEWEISGSELNYGVVLSPEELATLIIDRIARNGEIKSLMTPAQHRRMAALLREKFPNDPDTPDLAMAHEQIANALEKLMGVRTQPAIRPLT